jgi:ADP-ribose pyrophosphatase
MSDKKTEFEGKHVFIFTRDGWEFVERKSAKEAVAVVAATDDGKIVLTEQYRRAVDRQVIDLPAGLIGDEDDSDAAATAKKELEEETGYRCRAVERLAGGPSSPGITSEIVHLYRATGLTREGAGGGVAGEEITVHAVPLRDAAEWLRDKEKEGVLIDLKVWWGLYFLRGMGHEA